jgi:hypothetical protein
MAMERYPNIFGMARLCLRSFDCDKYLAKMVRCYPFTTTQSMMRREQLVAALVQIAASSLGANTSRFSTLHFGATPRNGILHPLHPSMRAAPATG